jgi:hypothetical protein
MQKFEVFQFQNLDWVNYVEVPECSALCNTPRLYILGKSTPCPLHGIHYAYLYVVKV